MSSLTETIKFFFISLHLNNIDTNHIAISLSIKIMNNIKMEILILSWTLI